MVDIVTHAFFRLHRFQFYRSSIVRSIGVLPPRPHALIASRRSPTPDLSYWYHPHTSRQELPVVFLHGIGVGLYPYMKFLEELNQTRQEKEKIGILAVEILSVSSRITPPGPRKEEMCRQLRVILQHHGFEKFVLASHSLVHPFNHDTKAYSPLSKVRLRNHHTSSKNARPCKSDIGRHSHRSRFNIAASTGYSLQLCKSRHRQGGTLHQN